MDGRSGGRRRGSAALLLAARWRRKGGENGHDSGRGDKDGVRARRARIADGRRVASPATTRGRGMGVRTTSLKNTVTEWNSFEMILIKV